MDYKTLLKKIGPFLYEIPASAVPGMRVPARLYISDKLLEDAAGDRSIEQLINVAMLPGVVAPVLAMPDIHEGYGFPIGGVAATELPRGVISPGGVGYDINCGVRLLISDFTAKEAAEWLETMATEFMRAIPSGTGRGGRIDLGKKEMAAVLQDGAAWCVEQGLGVPEDLEFLEEHGRLAGANPDEVSDTAKARGRVQLGTLGSGNHFLEIERVEEIFDAAAAENYGLFADQVVISIHCGSRGFGHQVCTDFVRVMLQKLPEYGFTLPDRELAAAPADSAEGERYLAAMAAAANFAWANRQVITHHLRLEWERIFGTERKLRTLYDVCHNIAKRETHATELGKKELLVHRKGATRAFGPGRTEVPAKYRAVGQPVLIPGTMGTASYVLRGTEEAMKNSFGTVCHGAGRRMSRHAAKRAVKGDELRQELENRGIIVRCRSNSGLVEEAPLAYKDVEEVVEVIASAGLSQKVARLRPLAVIKGD
ncbi:RtcB family protein [Patescibacteria group bacterium]|nr:MAG: RtcB family protein [Patescibacteria group bacterium]